MHKIEEFIINNSNSFILFLFAFITAFLLADFGFKFASVNNVYSQKLENVSFVEGQISKVIEDDTNTYIIVKDLGDTFFIRTKYIDDCNFNVDDYVVIHYFYNNPLSKKDCEIVNLQVNSSTVYSFDQFRQNTNMTVKLVILIGIATVFVFLVVLGVVFLKRNSRSKDSNYNSLWKGNDGEDHTNPETIERVRRKYINSFYSKNNRTYTSGVGFDETEFYSDIFFQVLADTVKEGELKVFYCDGDFNDDSIFVVCQIHNKKAVIYLISDENTHKFTVDQYTLHFMFEKDEQPTFEDSDYFVELVKNYNAGCENIFDIK